MTTKSKKTQKATKSTFYEVEAQITAAKIFLYGTSPKDFDGKVILLDMTKNLRGKNLELKMRIKYIEGKLKAEPISAKLVGSYVRKSIRRGADYVEDSFSAECKDYKVKVKPFLITRKRVPRAIRKALRDAAKKFIESYIKVRTARELFAEIMANKIQKSLAMTLKKIYPLSMCEIRVFEIESEKPNKNSENVQNQNEEIAPPGFEPGS